MCDCQIDVGDIVTVRSWDDMASEYEVDWEGDIHIRADGAYFTRAMRKTCGLALAVTKVDRLTEDFWLYTLEGYGGFEFTCSMLEPINSGDDSQEADIDVSAFFGLIAS